MKLVAHSGLKVDPDCKLGQRNYRCFTNPFFPTVPTFAVRETASLGQQMLELG